MSERVINFIADLNKILKGKSKQEKLHILNRCLEVLNNG